MEEVDVDEGIEMGEGDDNEPEEDDSDIEATQHENAQLLQRIEKSRSGVHTPNEAEVIKSIDLINFMVPSLRAASHISVTVVFTYRSEIESISSSVTMGPGNRLS